MPDIVQVVDAIDASPTVLLDLNDEVHWWTRALSAPPPRLRRSIAANAMRDGVHVGASTYDARTLTLELEQREGGQDAAAGEMQKLWRLLDSSGRFLRYQPQGASEPVFFRLYRSDTSQLEDVAGQAAMRQLTVEWLAEPFALGLKETLGPFTVNAGDPSATNGGYVDLPAIKGDVAADVVYWDANGLAYNQRLITVHSGPNAATPPVAIQGESMTLGTDTTNPGGGPDAVMSGAGTNNYLRTSFATISSLASRLTSASVSLPGGRYRVLVAVRRTAASGSVIEAAAAVTFPGLASFIYSPVTVIPASANRQLVDLGLVDWPSAPPLGASTVTGTTSAQLVLGAKRTGGTDTLDWDAVYLVPAGGQLDSAAVWTMIAKFNPAAPNLVLDSEHDRGFCTSSTDDPTTSSAVSQVGANLAGGFPRVMPGTSNRLHVLAWSSITPAFALGTALTVRLAYWPRYLHVRPVGS